MATPHRLATEAGLRMARSGGNAIDAALTAAATLCVVYPHNCSLGGDLLAVVRRPDRRTVFVNASGRAPSGLSPELLGARASMPVHGPHSVTVPGVVSGWTALAEHGARRSMREHLADAVVLAREGVPVAGSLAAALVDESPAVFDDAGMRRVLAPSGRPLRAGETLGQHALARTLEELGQDPDGFYRGALGSRLLTGMRALGVPVVKTDLHDHTASSETPLEGSVDGWLVRTAAPNSQGFVLLRILGALAAAGMRRGRLDRALPADAVARLFHGTARERDELLADPHAMRVDVTELLTAASLSALIADTVTDTGAGAVPATRRPSGDTVAVTAVDSEGCAVSLIQSVFHSFGSMLLEPDTGVVLHNRGAAFSLDPSSPNVLAPGKRPAHTLTPVLLESSDDVLAVGTMGGMAQPQILTQVISRLLAGESPGAAVSAPRWVVGGLGIDQSSHTVHWEEDLDADVRAELARHAGPDVRLPSRSEDVGHAQVSSLRDGVLASGTDPRADGSA